MKLRYRFSLVAFGVIVFLIITPLLVLYARGFKIDWRHRTLTKTGAIVIKTEPTKAAVFLNNEQQKTTTPANFRFVLPGDYNIRVEKDGYQSWTKRLNVKPQLVTWANADRDFVTLFLSTPKLDQTWQTQAASLSSAENQIAYIQNGQISMIAVDSGDVKNLGDIPQITLPPNSASLNWKWQNAEQISNLLKSAKWSLPPAQLTKIEHVETDGSHVALTINGDLYSLNGGNLYLIDKSAADFTLNNGIWYVQKNQIKHFDFSTQKSDVVSSITIPQAAHTQIIRTDSQVYLILDQALYVANDTLEKIYPQVGYAKFDQASRQLLFANDNEIYLYNPATKNSSLILRTLMPIKNAMLNTLTGYVFFQNEGKIKAAELDGRDHRNIFTIADALDNFTISKDGKKLYAVGQNQIQEYTVR